ncbi:unnamed protein product, partial [Musa textilis]
IYIYILKINPRAHRPRSRPNAPMRPTPPSTTFDKLLRLRGLWHAGLLDQVSSVVDEFEAGCGAAQCGHAHHFDRRVL